MFPRPNRYTVATMLALAVAGAVFAASAANPFRTEGGSPPTLDVAQAAVSEDAGVRFSVGRAAFSGSATFVEVSAATTLPELAGAVRVLALAETFSPASLRVGPGNRGLNVAVGTSSLARLSPVVLGSEATIAFTQVEVALADGSSRTLAGKWNLPLEAPRDLAQRLRVEQLRGAAGTANGITLTLDAAIRSSTETLVTVSVSGTAGVRPLAEPSILADGELLRGGLVAEQEGGRLLTYSFPPTPFGSEVTISFGPFVRLNDAGSGRVIVDVGAVLARTGARGDDQETLAVSPADTLLAEGALAGVRSLVFTERYGSNGRPAPAPSLRLIMNGALAGMPTQIAVTGPNGKPFQAEVAGVGYSKDAAGTISSPRTEIVLAYDSLADLRGVFTVLWAGRDEELIRGDWSLTLSPQ